MEHTKAPWIIEDNYKDRGVINAQDGGPIADVWGVGFSTEKSRKANTHLIAAAPELLEACEFLISESDRRGIHIKDGISFQKARDAIKKAKGKQ